MARMNEQMTDLMRYSVALGPQERTGCNKSHSVTTTMDSAFLVPLMYDRVLPGDEKKIRVSALARMATPIHPVMDQANLDVWAFFVPDRLWWRHAKEFYGENLQASFNPDGEYTMPSLHAKQFGVNTRRGRDVGIGSLNDYFGFPVIVDSVPWSDEVLEKNRVTAGLHRSYQLIWNEWFRNSSIQPALKLSTDDEVTDEEWNVIKQIRKVCKYPDYFTTLLKTPQAGDDVLLPLGDWAPVVTRTESHSAGSPWMNFVNSQGNPISGDLGLYQGPGDSNGGLVATGSAITTDSASAVTPVNLWADLNSVPLATINNLRNAVTIQHLLEVDQIAGKRFQNIIYAHFSVFTPDSTLQRPELLGMCRQEVGMRQVLQTSGTQLSAGQVAEGTTPQGNVSAFSVTNMSNEWLVNKGFTEPGVLLVVCAIRPVHSYSQGIDPLLTKLNRYDHYWPVLDHIGNQPVYKRSIFACWSDNGSHATPDSLNQVLGYAPAWMEYRIKNNKVTGLMRPDLAIGSLASWNYSDLYQTSPTLNSAFVMEDENLLDRTIAVQDEPQFLVDVYFDYLDYKPMSVNSAPGVLYL